MWPKWEEAGAISRKWGAELSSGWVSCWLCGCRAPRSTLYVLALSFLQRADLIPALGLLCSTVLSEPAEEKRCHLSRWLRSAGWLLVCFMSRGWTALSLLNVTKESIYLPVNVVLLILLWLALACYAATSVPGILEVHPGPALVTCLLCSCPAHDDRTAACPGVRGMPRGLCSSALSGDLHTALWRRQAIPCAGERWAGRLIWWEPPTSHSHNQRQF